jgi:hypothetical protein
MRVNFLPTIKLIKARFDEMCTRDYLLEAHREG